MIWYKTHNTCEITQIQEYTKMLTLLNGTKVEKVSCLGFIIAFNIDRYEFASTRQLPTTVHSAGYVPMPCTSYAIVQAWRE